MNKKELKDILDAVSLNVNEEARLEELSGEVEVLKNNIVFSKVAISAEKFQLKYDGTKKVIITIKERLTDNEFKLSLGAVMRMSANLKERINVNGLLREADFISIQNISLTLAELCSDVSIVDSFPMVDDEETINSNYFKALYESLIEDLINGILFVTESSKDFTNEDKEYVGLLCKKFGSLGKDVILMSTEALKEALEICDMTKFKSIMRCWRKCGFLFVNESAANTGRMQIRHRLKGTDKYSWYAIVLPKGANLGTVSTVGTNNK